MTVAWFGCEAGASGDMFLGALVDAGAPVEDIQRAIDALAVERVLVSADEVSRAGLTATKVTVAVGPSDVVRTWPNVRHLLETADLPDGVRTSALRVFALLAAAEGRAHRVPPEQVHFHEVGALDALADVVGSCAALASLGVDTVGAGPVSVGSGMVRAEHGLLPVPGPAVVALLTDAGATVQGGRAPYEMCTPTGAALLAAHVTTWGPMPPMRIAASGYGAGSRDLDEVPNVLQVVLGEAAAAATPAPQPSDASVSAVVLAANVDDLDPRLWPGVLATLLDAGAADAWLTPIVMKKGRPAHTVSVLCRPEHTVQLREVLFTDTSTLGVRETDLRKHEADREFRSVEVRGQPIRVKVGRRHGEIVNAQPEFDDVVAAAAVLGMAEKSVLAAAIAAAHGAQD